MSIAKTKSRSSIPYHQDGSQTSKLILHSRLLLTLFALAGITLGHTSADRRKGYADSTNQYSFLTTLEHIPPPPATEPIEVIELPLPPVSASKEPGACTTALNPHRTGCIAQDVLPFGIPLLESVRYFLAESSTIFYNLHFHSFDVICLRTPHVYNLVYLLRRTINTVLICSC
jgi:hypothetical protein